MRKLGLKNLFLICVLSLGSTAQALDIYGRSATDCQSLGGVKRCGHGPSATDPSIQALYTFDSVSWNTTAGHYQINDLSGHGNHLLIYSPNPNAISNDKVFTNGNVAMGTDFLSDPVSGQVDKQASYIDIRKPILLQSVKPLDVSMCKANNEVSVEAWVYNDRGGAEDQLAPLQRGPLKIVSLSGASNDADFFIGHNYVNAAEYQMGVRTGKRNTKQVDVRMLQNSPDDDFAEEQFGAFLSSGDSNDSLILMPNMIQHLMLSELYSKSDGIGTASMYVSTGATNPKNWTPTRRDRVSVPGASFANWGNFYLNVGNEATAFSDSDHAKYPVFDVNTGATTEDLHWRGKIYLVAVYCRGLSDGEVLGSASGASQFKRYTTDINAKISKAHLLAAKIYRSITGVGIPLAAPIISGDPNIPDTNEDFMAKDVQNYLDGNDSNGLYKAAELATNEDNFYNITVRDMAKKMSVRNESVATPFNDMSAMFVGVTRDNADARDLLTANYWYWGDPSLTAVPNNVVADILKSNNHYASLEKEGYNLRKVLVKYKDPVSGSTAQRQWDGTTNQENPDPAGVLTSRAFMAAHAIAGTNRRMIEYTFREFMCLEMPQWANASGPDDWVGADVSRQPGGDHNKFLQTCRGCHSNMDAFRGAFAKFNFGNGFVKYADQFASRAVNTENAEDMNTMALSVFPASGQQVALKLNRNPIYNVCPVPTGETLATWCVGTGKMKDKGTCKCKVGKEVDSDKWVNYANLGLNKDRFGWHGKMEGRGATEFGRLIAYSDQFSKCMTRRVFRAVCKRDPLDSERGMIDSVAAEFRSADALNYNLRLLFARVAVTHECTGE